MRDKDPIKKKIEPSDAKKENRQHATKWITRKQRIGTYTKKKSKIRGVIFITDWKITLKNK